MTYAIEQQAKSGLGHLQWLRVAGPFESRAAAEAAMTRRATRIGKPERVVELAA